MDVFDLFGMEVKERRAKTEFTVLTNENKWSNQEVSGLVNGLRTEVHGHPQHPETLILCGNHSEEEIRKILGEMCFKHKIVVGYENPDLPWKPSF